MLKNEDIDYKFWAYWLAITFLYVIIRMHILDIPLDRDEGIFGYAGQQILDGGIPYRDIFDHKPPVIFYVYAFSLLFVPPTPTGIHIFLLIYNFLTLIVVYLIAKGFTESATTGLWAAFAYAIFSSNQSIQGFTASTEMVMLLPITLCLLFSVTAMKRNSNVMLVLSGVMGAMACWTKQTAVFSVFFVIAYVVIKRVFLNKSSCSKLHEHVVKSLLFWAAGGIGISIVIISYFYAKHLFSEFVYWSFIHSFYYSKAVTLPNKNFEIYGAIKDILLGNLPLITVGILMCFLSIMTRNKHGVFFLGFLLFSLLGTIPGYAYQHYFAQIAPAIALAGGFGISYLITIIKSEKGKTVSAIIIAIFVVGWPLCTDANYYYKQESNWTSRNLFGASPFCESMEVANFISTRTSIEDSVFILGSEAQILFYANRKSATSFALIYPLMFSTPRNKEFQEKAWNEIIHNHPKYILKVNIQQSILWDGKADLAFMDKTAELLKTAYYLEAMMPVMGEKRRLMIFHDSVDDKEILKIIPSNILIYRLKGT